MAKAIVTGGAGFIGSHLVDALAQNGHQVIVVDNLSTGRRSNIHPRAKLIIQDIRSPRIKDVFSQLRPDYVFHLAAQKNVRFSIENPLVDADVNITGALNIIELSRQHKVKKFIFSSTSGALYGSGAPLPTPETASPRPESPYGIAKFTIEQYLNFYRRNLKLDSVSLRYANVYGPRQDPKGEAGVVAIFAGELLHRQPLSINGHGRQTRDYVYVADVISANLLAMKNKRGPGEINIGTGQQTSVNSVAATLQRIANIRVKTRHRPAIAGEVQKSAVSWRLAKKQLRWEPKVKFQEGLTLTWAWARTAL